MKLTAIKIITFIIAIITLIFVMGCSYKDGDRSKNLTARVDQFWEYIRTAQYQKAWEMCSQQFKIDINREEFVRNMEALFSEEATKIVRAAIRTIKFNDNYANLEVEISCADNAHITYEDIWLFESGDWMFDRGGMIVGSHQK